MTMFNKIFQQVKERKIRKWLAIYTSTALTIIGLLHLFSLRYQLPSYIFDVPLILLIFGLFASIVAAWYHGKEGHQKIKIGEIILYTILLFGALSVIIFGLGFPFKKSTITVEANSIAVLPFKNLSDSKEDEYFSDGVTEDILTHLSKISGLKVISRTSAMKYKNLEKNIREIGKELGVETILEGSIRRSGDRVRIVGQLIDASTDAHIWSETYDREMKDIFAIQSEIAEKIAAALHATLLPIEKEMIETETTSNIDAYTFYLKGRHHYYNYNNEDNDKAIDMFNKALDIDSNYALAYAGLADAYNQRVFKYWYSEEWYDSALVLSKKAVKINPNLAEGYKALALSYDSKGERELAIINYERAIRLNPNYASAILNYGLIKSNQGKLDEALYWFRRAASLEPDNIWVTVSIGNVYKFLMCDSLAIYWSQKAVSLDSKNSYILMLASDIYLSASRFDEAKKHVGNSIASDSSTHLAWYFKSQIETVLGNYKLAKESMDYNLRLTQSSNPEYFYAFILLKLNEKDKAMKILNAQKEEYVEYLKEYPKSASTMDYNALAEIYAILDEKENAFKLWEEAIDKGWLDTRRNTLYPYFENLRGETEYQRLLNKMQVKIESLKSAIRKKYPEYEICK